MKTVDRVAALKAMFQPDNAATRPALSGIHLSVYEWLYAFVAVQSYQPSVREIGIAFGFSNTAAVVKVLNVLHDKGYIVRDSANARALVLR